MTFAISPDLILPQSAVTQAFALLGRRGSGKSYAAGKLAEVMLDSGAQVVVVDPVGVWFGLRLDAAGKGAGISIPVFGGQRADIPLEASAGALVAQLVAERGISVVLDVSEFSGAEQRRFVADFATTLLSLKKRHRSPVMLMFDESQEFVPQQVRPDHARMVGAMEKLVKLGRNFGIGVCLLSQRPQAVNKDVLNQTEVLMVFQLTGPQERKVIEGWVNDHGFGQKEIDELPRLPAGTAFVWSPQWLGRFARVKIGRKRTFDASATPEEGGVFTGGALAAVDLDEVRAAMAATTEEAKANDPKALREQIARLRAKLAASDVGPLSREVDRLRADLEHARANPRQVTVPIPVVFEEQVTDLENAISEGTRAMTAILTKIQDAARVMPTPAPSDPPRRNGTTHTPTARPLAPTPSTGKADGDGAARILRALASRHPRPLTRAQVGVLAVIKPTGGSFGTYISRLAVGGLISREGQFLSLTAAGVSAAARDQPGARELLAFWGEKLGGKTREILTLMADGQERTKAQIADEVGVEVNGGSFGTYLSRLKSNGLVARSPGGFTATPEMVR